MKYLLVIVLISVIGLACCREATTIDDSEAAAQLVAALPKDIKACSRNDPQRDECLKTGLQKILDHAKNGYPEFGMRPIDPLDISNSTFAIQDKDSDGNLDIKTGQIVGLGQTTVKDVKSKFQNDKVDLMVRILFPKIFIEATFKGFAVINKQKFTPIGYMNGTFTSVEMIWKIKGDIIPDKNGKNVVNVTKFDMVPEIEDLKIYATGLVPDPVMNQMIVNLINQNWKTQYQQLFLDSKPEWEPVVITAANRFFSQIPYDKLFPENSPN